MRDIVYFLKGDLPEDGRELRYSLRSLTNLPHGRVWLVAPEIPEWVQGITWIPWPQQPGQFYDTNAKMVALSRYDEGMTDDIYQMDDDFYIIKPTESIPLYWNVPAKRMMSVRRNSPEDPYGEALHNTINLLEGVNVPSPLASCVHSPFPVTRTLWPMHWDDGGALEYKTVYLNYVKQQGEKVVYMVGDPKSRSYKETAAIAKRPYGLLSSLEGEFQFVEKVLKNLFPEKSEYEL